MRIFVIGGSGFIGKNIINFLKKTKEHQVKGISTNEIDLTKKDSNVSLSKHLKTDCIVIMCAGVKKQLGDNLKTFENNTLIINNFCKSVSVSPPKKIIFFSSASVYGEDVAYTEKISEETTVNLRSYYGLAKFVAERLLEKTCEDSGTQLLILRPPLVYGKDDMSRGYGPTGFTYKAFNNEKIILWGDGSEFREFVYVGDLVKIVSMLIHSEFQGILNLISGKSHSYSETINILKKTMGMSVNVEFRERTKEKVDHHFSNKLIRKVFDNFEFTDFESGIKKLCSSIKSG